MYQSPIEIISKDMSMNLDNEILYVIQSYGIDVDKNELVRALKYDRNQYEKGYRDGYESCRQEVIEELEKSRKIFCRNRVEYSVLSTYEKARVDEIDNCIAILRNLPIIERFPKIE